MEPFECQGYWWTPNHTDRCPGALRCDESGELRLHLFGEFANLDERATGADLPVVYGELVDLAGVERTAPKGQFVTLLHSFVSNRHHGSSGPSTQTLFAHRAFFGDSLLTAGSERLKRATLHFSGLAGWASDLTGITRGADALFSRSWEQPEAVRIGFPKGSLLLSVGVSAPSTARRWTLEEHLGFHLTYRLPVTDSELSGDVGALQNFLTFATDRPNSLTRLEVHQREDESRTPLTVLGPPVFDDESAAEGVMAHELLFGHADVANRLGDVICRWFEMSERHSSAFAIYFGLKYNPPRYSDLRFQLMAQALSLYHTGGRGDGSVRWPANILPHLLEDAPEAAARDELARTHPGVVLANALRTLTYRFAVVFDPLVNARDAESRVLFLEMATRTFQYVLGRESGAPQGSKGTTYYWLTELLGFLWKMALLSDLGFTVEEQQKLFERNRIYQHVRHKIAPELFGAGQPNS